MDRFRDVFVRVVLGLAFAVPVYFMAAALATRFGLIPWTLGLTQMTMQWGQIILWVVAFIALGALVMAFFVPPRRGMSLAALALAIPLMGMGYCFYLEQQARAAPPIHDVSTDLLDPPAFSPAVLSARAAIVGGNESDLLSARVPASPTLGPWAGRPVTEVVRNAYPEINSIPTGLAPAPAFELALALAREQNWTIGHIDSAAGVIEATARSFWFGFTDDVVVRVRPDGIGARVDMRSVSRVGLSDRGVNARRVQDYLEQLRPRLEAAES